MFKWLIRIVFIGVLGYLGLMAFFLHRSGHFELGNLPDGAYTISFESGFRGIVEGVEIADPSIANQSKYFRRLTYANKDRKYLGFPLKVPTWLEDKWSTCAPPTEQEISDVYASLSEEAKRNLRGARLDAICVFDIDGEKIPRGLLFSVPRL